MSVCLCVLLFVRIFGAVRKRKSDATWLNLVILVATIHDN